MEQQIQIKFIKGIATIKQKNKIVAKFFDREIFFQGLKVNYSKKFCLELPKLGISTESNNLQELILLMQKYI